MVANDDERTGLQKVKLDRALQVLKAKHEYGTKRFLCNIQSFAL